MKMGPGLLFILLCRELEYRGFQALIPLFTNENSRVVHTAVVAL